MSSQSSHSAPQPTNRYNNLPIPKRVPPTNLLSTHKNEKIKKTTTVVQPTILTRNQIINARTGSSLLTSTDELRSSFLAFAASMGSVDSSPQFLTDLLDLSSQTQQSNTPSQSQQTPTQTQTQIPSQVKQMTKLSSLTTDEITVETPFHVIDRAIDIEIQQYKHIVQALEPLQKIPRLQSIQPINIPKILPRFGASIPSANELREPISGLQQQRKESLKNRIIPASENAVSGYDILTIAANSTNPTPLYPDQIILRAVVYSSHSYGKLCEMLILDSQPLTAFRDAICGCLHDEYDAIDWTSTQNVFPRREDGEKQTPSGFFFIENTFYDDMRSKRAIRYSDPIVKWAQEKIIPHIDGVGVGAGEETRDGVKNNNIHRAEPKRVEEPGLRELAKFALNLSNDNVNEDGNNNNNRDMAINRSRNGPHNPNIIHISPPNKTMERYLEPGIFPYRQMNMEHVLLSDLRIRLGAHYLYQHQGNCQHTIIFTEMRVRSVDDINDASVYPLLTFKQKVKLDLCCICNEFGATCVTYNDKYAPSSPAFFCDTCYDLYHMDEFGNLFYTDYTIYKTVPVIDPLLSHPMIQSDALYEIEMRNQKELEFINQKPRSTADYTRKSKKQGNIPTNTQREPLVPTSASASAKQKNKKQTNKPQTKRQDQVEGAVILPIPTSTSTSTSTSISTSTTADGTMEDSTKDSRDDSASSPTTTIPKSRTRAGTRQTKKK